MKQTTHSRILAKRGLPVFGAAFMALALPVGAATYIGTTYEGFDYATGNLGTANGGTGFNATGDPLSANTSSWSTSGTPAPSVMASSLIYTADGYASASGNKLTLAPNSGTSISATRALGQTVATNTVGSMYFSFLMQRTNDSVRTLNVAFFGTAELFAIGQFNAADVDVDDYGTLMVRGLNTSGTPIRFHSDNPIDLNNDVHLIIGKLDFNVSGQDDRLTLWVNPTDVTGGEDSLTPYLTAEFELRNTTINNFRPFAGGGTTVDLRVTGNFDEFRFGSDFESVVIPEPSAALLGGLGLLALLGHRRRH